MPLSFHGRPAPKVKAFRYLCRKSAPLKKDEIIYGFQPVLEAIKAGKDIEKLLLLKTLHPAKLQEVKKEATAFRIPFQFVPREKLNKFTRQNHQGVIALVSPVSYVEITQLVPMLFESGRMPLLLALDRVTDVRNVGSIARTAECAGVDGLLIPARGSAMINADAVKTSAGALSRLPVCRVSSLTGAIRYLRESGLSITGTREGSPTSYHQADYNIPMALVMGSEEQGISPDVMELCDTMVSIPLHGQIESLNVAVATGIILFEAAKQRSGEQGQ